MDEGMAASEAKGFFTRPAAVSVEFESKGAAGFQTGDITDERRRRAFRLRVGLFWGLAAGFGQQNGLSRIRRGTNVEDDWSFRSRQQRIPSQIFSL